MNSDGHRTRTRPLIVVLGVITAFDAMAIDLYLPGFRDIERSLGANPGTMQTSLSVFVGGAAIGQLFYGPVTDRFGRRGPLAFGILLFVLASVLAALSQNMAMFMVARALQGLGAAAGLVIPRAIITDRYQGREVAKLFSALLQVMMIAPIVAPPIGGLLVATMGCRRFSGSSRSLALRRSWLCSRSCQRRWNPHAVRPRASASRCSTMRAFLDAAGSRG